MATYRISEDSGASEIIEADSLDDALAVACDWATNGEYDRRVMVTVWAVEIDDGQPVGETISDQVEAGPEPTPPPGCDHNCDWQSPYELIGGCRENPGVWSRGGTSISITEVCQVCGCYRHTYIAGSQRNPDELPETVEYSEADDASLEWIERSRTR